MGSPRKTMRAWPRMGVVMDGRYFPVRFVLSGLIASASFFVGPAHAATKTVDLDGNPANGAESQCDLNVLQTFPVMIENKVTNKSGGDAFGFSWPSAGPGGFTSSVTAGTTGGVGAKWVWTTNQSIFSYTGNSCANDVCFTQTAGPDSIASFCSDACLADATSVTIARGATAGTVVLSWTGGQSTFTIYRSTSKIGIVASANAIGTTSTQTFTDTPPGDATVFYVVRGVDCITRKACVTNTDCSAPGDGPCISRGPFGVPGRSLFSTNVTVSSASLTSSLITFFSPPTEVFRATSTAGAGGTAFTVTNSGTAPVTVTTPAYPPGCCPADPSVPHQLRCGEACVDYLNDSNNCGACGNVCGDGACCSNGSCVSLCAVGDLWCNGECADIQDDSNNCGGCGTICGDGTCCNNGTCQSLCDVGRLWCNNQCVDFGNDSGSCGSCGTPCGSGTCCDGGSCVSVCPAGQVWCGTECVDFANDSANCGACGTACGDGTCCNNGACESFCPAGQVLCGTQCVDFQNDSGNCGACGNACGDGTCCNGGACVSECPAGRTFCNGQCVDLQHDPRNCGSCGNVCGSHGFDDHDNECNQGHCEHDALYNPLSDPLPIPAVCPNPAPTTPGPGFCHNSTPTGPTPGFCHNSTPTDPTPGFCHNATPSDPTPGFCHNATPSDPTPGFCHNESPTNPTPGFCRNGTPSDPIPGSCPNTTPSSPVPGYCQNTHPSSGPVPGVCPEPGSPAPTEGETTTCTVNESTQTIPPGGSATTCNQGGVLFKEVATEITVCGDGIPGVNGVCNNTATKITTGTFNRLVPDPTLTVGNAYVTPYSVRVVADTSNDGLIEPGETASLVIEALNAGLMNITQASATLSAPAVDLTDDGVVNPVGITVGTASASYGTILGTPVSTNCTAPPPQPASNATVFPITVPSNHPGDTSHPFILAVTGTVNGGPFSMSVPIVLGIADKCEAAANTRDYDGVDGLSSPMAKLAPAGDPVPFPSKAFSAGNTRPLKLRVLCGVVNLTDATVDAPEIVGLSEATRGPLDIHALNLNSDNTNNPNDPFFRFNNSLSGGQWAYSMRTALIGRGSFTLTIRVAGRKNYVTGFVLN